MESRTYIGMTIGPIDRVADMAKRGTRVLWATSYIFSYLARNIVEKFYIQEKRYFVLPQWSEEGCNPNNEIFAIKNGSGLFPDRYIFEAKDDDFKELSDHKDKVLQDLADKIRGSIALPETESEKVREYVRKIFKVYFVQKTYSFYDNEVVKDISSMLDMLECEDLFPEVIIEGGDYLEQFFDKVESFLVDDAFGEENILLSDNRIIKTTFEYSACELKQEEYWKSFGIEPPRVNLVFQQGDPFVGKVDKEVKDKYMPYHNYIAVVKADGDYMSDTLKNMASKDISVYHLDHNLLQYNKAVGELIRAHGGVPVFLGGDDLLFFAPVIGVGHKSVFELLDEINTVFNEYMQNLVKAGLSEGEMKLTLSFGVSISYYKFPIYESRNAAEELLNEAKMAGKNRLKWQLRKHSGQIIQSGDIDKANNEFYKNYISLIKENAIITSNKDEGRLYSSFVYWLNEHKAIISEISSDNIKLTNYFKNSFEKPIHNNDIFKKFYEKVLNMICVNHNDEHVLETMYGVLRFILFVKNYE